MPDSIWTRGEPLPVYCNYCAAVMQPGTTAMDINGYDRHTGEKIPATVYRTRWCPNGGSGAGDRHDQWLIPGPNGG